MKILILLIFIVFFKLSLWSQIGNYDTIPHTLNIKCNPFAIFQGPILYTAEYRLGFEKTIATFSTVQVLGSYLNKAPYAYYIEAYNNERLIIEGYRIQLEYKNYFWGRKHGVLPFEGFYWAINGSYSHVSITNSYYKLRNQNISATYQYLAVKLGYQYVYNHYTFDFYYGMGFRDIIWQTNIPQNGGNTLNKYDFVPFKNSLKILLGINIGFRI
ncbi:MAG: hypothetical protein Fur0028_13100 [Bacteroidales bacterium]